MIFSISCSSTKLSKRIDGENDNLFVEICLLENSKGLTIDEYFENVDLEERQLVINFFNDEKYMDSLKGLMATIEGESEIEVSREKMDEMTNSASVDYPKCISIFPMFMSMAGNTIN